MKMKSICILLIVSCFCTYAQAAYNCTACDKGKCPPDLSGCSGHNVIDPCGCCVHCPKQKWEPCGGPNWELGYCGKDLRCNSINGSHPVEYPNIGICKKHWSTVDHYAMDDDENCPKQSGCYRVMGTCDCVTKHTCFLDFSLSSYDPLYCDPQFDDPSYDHLYKAIYNRPCTHRGCDIVDNQCTCTTAPCSRIFEFKDGTLCNKALIERLCVNVTCPEPEPLNCPSDSVQTKPHTPHGKCCPTVPSYCTCDFTRCVSSCPKGKRMVVVWKSDGVPGQCCDRHLCLL